MERVRRKAMDTNQGFDRRKESTVLKKARNVLTGDPYRHGSSQIASPYTTSILFFFAMSSSSSSRLTGKIKVGYRDGSQRADLQGALCRLKIRSTCTVGMGWARLR